MPSGEWSVDDRRIRPGWAALRDRRRNPVRPRLPTPARGVLFPHGAVRRWKDVAAQASLPRAAADPRPAPVVRPGPRRPAALGTARLPPPDRRHLPGFPP